MNSDFCPNYLEHHGIFGMSWGVQNGPPYPLDSKEHAKVIKKGQDRAKNFIKDMKASHAAKKRAKKRQESLAKARAARAEKRKREAYERKLDEDKERVLNSGTATELARYKGRLTNKELQDSLQRLENEAKLLAKAKEEGKKPDKTKEFFDKLEKVTKYAKAGVDAYDTFAEIYNALAEPSKPIKKIKGGNNNEKKDNNNNNNNGVSKGDIENLLNKYQKALKQQEQQEKKKKQNS